MAVPPSSREAQLRALREWFHDELGEYGVCQHPTNSPSACAAWAAAFVETGPTAVLDAPAPRTEGEREGAWSTPECPEHGTHCAGETCCCADLHPSPAPRGEAVEREALARLRLCDQTHGGEGNSAEVYGHPGSSRTCLRLKGTDTWIYDPEWEQS